MGRTTTHIERIKRVLWYEQRLISKNVAEVCDKKIRKNDKKKIKIKDISLDWDAKNIQNVTKPTRPKDKILVLLR